MSCHVDLIYNPFSQAARLTINHLEFARPGSKIQKMIVNKPMNHWLEAMTCGYLQWNGFLPELVSETNEIHIEFVFEGNTEDYYRFSEAIRRQAAALSESGFDPIDVRIIHKERYSIQQLQDHMHRLRKEWNAAVPTQSLILHRDRLDHRLESDLNAEETITLIEEYIDLIRQMQRTAAEAEKAKFIEMHKAWEALLDREDRQ